ncbi:response regulator [Polluticoccus soli]|uniref:response regulator n=1 Tax=Polluticoccus soli TaxID=3034150 RepID=UPI0023E129B8|nr:response regulator [Flavipsychrobacter sp. JY13-12]
MNKQKIVIVENDQDEQFFMREAFENSGLFDIIAIVKNGDTLQEWLAGNGNNLPDVILSDLNMPGKNGYDILEEMKANAGYSNIPIIITSTSSTKNTIDKVMSLGAADYMAKPDTFIEYDPFAKRLYDIVGSKQLEKK